jgi:hypothetical protein
VGSNISYWKKGKRFIWNFYTALLTIGNKFNYFIFLSDNIALYFIDNGSVKYDSMIELQLEAKVLRKVFLQQP